MGLQKKAKEAREGGGGVRRPHSLRGGRGRCGWMWVVGEDRSAECDLESGSLGRSLPRKKEKGAEPNRTEGGPE